MIIARLYKDTLLLKSNFKEGFKNVSFNKDTLEVNEIREDLEKDGNPYIDKEGIFHVYEVKENQILE